MVRKYFSLLIILLTSCAVNNEMNVIADLGGDVKLIKSEFADLRQWQNDDHLEALKSFNRSCKKEVSNVKVADKLINAELIQNKCKILQNINSNSKAKEFFENNFIPYKITYLDSENQIIDKGLFTGYYEISLNGSFEKTDKFQFPLYTKPNITNDEHFTREEITNGALEGKNLEILYLDDEVKRYMLHVQGSGIVNMTNGEKVYVGYSGKNKHHYVSIGKYLIKIRAISHHNISAESINKWFYQNPDLINEVMNKNPSYVFFQIKDQPATGSENVVLTKERSIAIDHNIYPYGIPFWIESKYPNSPKEFNKLLISQDSGSAIKGAIRADIFFGNGLQAQKNASYMKSLGSMFILLPK